MTIQNIAIIGAGWSGLQIAQVMLECGYTVTLFESLDDVGGTWHPQLAYYGLSVHFPIYACAFYDFPYPGHHNKLKKLQAIDIFNYCKLYAKEKLITPLITFNTDVTHINYYSKNNNCVVTCLDKTTNKTYDCTFDFVINTHFNAPRVPSFPGQEQFKGKIYHSNEIKESTFQQIVDSQANVVVLGGSKSATDIALIFSERNYDFKWLLREMYLFYNYNFLFYNVKKEKAVSKINFFLSLPRLFLISKFAFIRRLALYWLLLIGCIKRPGRNSFDLRKFHGGVLDSYQLSKISAMHNKVYSSVEKLQENVIVLTNGAKLDCDVLICATGCDTFSEKIKLFSDGKQLAYDEIKGMYEYSVIADIPLLYFTGLTGVSFNGPINSYNRAACILKYMEKVPSKEQLNEIVEEHKTGKPKHFLFDGSQDSAAAFYSSVQTLMKNMCTPRDLFKYSYNLFFKHCSEPYGGAERYIDSKRMLKYKKNL